MEIILTGRATGKYFIIFRGGAFGFKLDTLNKFTELKSNDNKKTLIFFIVDSLLDKERSDMFEIKLKENDDEDVTINSLTDSLKDVRKNFMFVNKLNERS